MAWSGSLSESSAKGSSVTFTPGAAAAHAYASSAFTAPKKAVYRFILKGSGGAAGEGSGAKGAPGSGGKTTGYLLLDKGQTVYVGAGGPCSAAYVASAQGEKLAAIARSALLFVAGAGGGAGAAWDNNANFGTDGGHGGGTSGAAGTTLTDYGTQPAGKGGTQSAGGAGGQANGSYGAGGLGAYLNINGTSSRPGDGGDGYYGGGSGYGGQGYGTGGGGGSGYVKTAQLTVAGTAYTSSTSQGGGAAGGANGSVQVTYYADAELPLIFNGTRLTKLIVNGVEVKSLIYNGKKLFMRREGSPCLT